MNDDFHRCRQKTLVFNASTPVAGAYSTRLNSSVGSGRLSQDTDNRRSAYCERVTLNVRIGYSEFEDSSLRSNFLVLEDRVSSCLFPGCLDQSNLTEDLSSHSRDSCIPNSLVSVSPLPTPLSIYFLVLSWT